MFTRHSSARQVLPREYRSASEKLFPHKGFPEGKGPSLEAVEAFAKILGVGEDYRRLWKDHASGQAAEDFLNRFQNNLDLLIQKTWVEKADEIRKEALLDKVPPFIALIEKGDYPRAIEEFGIMLKELAYLFFGAQSQKDDFTEYTLRIDPQMGLFWWYGGQINSSQIWAKKINQDVLYALLLLGICYLVDF